MYQRLLIESENMPENIVDYKSKEWKGYLEKKQYFLDNKKFLAKIKVELDPKLEELTKFSQQEQEGFTNHFQAYIAQIFGFMVNYFPYQSDLVDSLDFVTFTMKPEVLRGEILSFNGFFRIIPQDQIKALCDEIDDLTSQDLYLLRAKAKDSSLKLWSLIEGMQANDNMDIEPRYKLLGKLLRIAHTLPVSSAVIEQSFSRLKLVKSLSSGID